MAMNLPASMYDGTLPTDPNVEAAGSGMEGGAANTPGIGINTGDVNPKASDWPRATINPAEGQQIGTTAISLQAIDYATPDVNDTFAFAVADTAAAPGAVFDTVTGAVNRSSVTTVIGEWGWGTVPVA